MKLVFAGGGTGGHVYPALAVADELRTRHERFDALFIGNRDGLEARVVPESGFRIRFVVSRGVRGRGLLGKARTCIYLAIGTMQSIFILSSYRPDLVYGSGGYVSATVVIAAFLLRKKVVLQEQNSIPGLANRLLAPCAGRIYLGFEKAASHFKDGKKLLVTGNPLRSDIGPGDRPGARSIFGLAEDRPVLLVFGGSQGATTLNNAAAELLLGDERLQGIVQTGKKDYERISRMLAPAEGRVFVSDYISQISEAYAAADVALARSGALSVSEIAAVGLPSVLVPYPWSVDDHQLYNARVLEDAGAAVIIENDKLDVSSLAGAVYPILDDPGKRERMSRALLKLGGTNAARRIAEDIENITGVMHGAPGSAENGGCDKSGLAGRAD